MNGAREPGTIKSKPPRLLDQVRHRIRSYHRPSLTEEICVDWIKRYIRFFDKRHPRDLGANEIDRFLTHLALEEHIAAAELKQARLALSFLYEEVLQIELALRVGGSARTTGARRSPTALTRNEVDDVVRHLRSPSHRLICRMIHGAGLGLVDVLQVRIDDIDLARAEIVVVGARGKKKVAALSRTLVASLEEHLAAVQALHRVDVAAGRGNAYLTLALARKHPHSAREWRWQYAFPAAQVAVDPRSGIVRRHHLQAEVYQRAFDHAVREAESEWPVASPASPPLATGTVAPPPTTPTLGPSRWELAYSLPRGVSRDLFHQPA